MPRFVPLMLTLIGAGFATSAVADPCRSIDRLISTNVATGSSPTDWAQFLAANFGSNSRSRQSNVCTSSDSELAICRWQFSLRDVEAQTLYRDLGDTIAGCVADPGDIFQDVPVNHPDAYSATIFPFPGHQLSLSIKDKSALGATFVVFRVKSAP